MTPATTPVAAGEFLIPCLTDEKLRMKKEEFAQSTTAMKFWMQVSCSAFLIPSLIPHSFHSTKY